jgi:hypothetical protein
MISMREERVGATRKANSRPVGSALRTGGRNEASTTAWYRQTKETKCGGTDHRGSEPFIVPVKPGNLALRDPVEGRGGRIIES